MKPLVPVSLLVLQLTSAADENDSFIEVLETFTCLAPILDMSVVDLDKQGRDVVGTMHCMLDESEDAVSRIGSTL